MHDEKALGMEMLWQDPKWAVLALKWSWTKEILQKKLGQNYFTAMQETDIQL